MSKRYTTVTGEISNLVEATAKRKTLKASREAQIIEAQREALELQEKLRTRREKAKESALQRLQLKAELGRKLEELGRSEIRLNKAMATHQCREEELKHQLEESLLAVTAQEEVDTATASAAEASERREKATTQLAEAEERL